MELKFEDMTGLIIQACMNVHRELGSGFLKPVYQDALAIEFKTMGIKFVREAKIEIYYKGIKLDKGYFADFICFDEIIVELKAVTQLVSAHKAQVINYLKGTNKQIGLLINFGSNSLKWERISRFEKRDAVRQPESV
ncbi:GxxExxY protein [Treponema sp.]|uniref:GxxExxY protein n=1 Tax=Treponema sp. TaxID=166 RepID=UPI00388E758E